MKQAETTQEEIAAPGKLPETPLRMDPDLLYEDGEEELGHQADQQTTEKSIKESMSSYSVRNPQGKRPICLCPSFIGTNACF